MKLNLESRKFAVNSVWLMLGKRHKKDAPQRLRNFIRVNYGVVYTLKYCRRMWRLL